MIKLIVCFILCVTSSALGNGRKANKRFLKVELLQMEEYYNNLTSSIRNLVIANCKVKLADMANELAFKNQVVIFGINHAVTSIKNETLHDEVAELLADFTDVPFQVQKHVHKGPENLKQHLGKSFEKGGEILHRLSKVIQNTDFKDEVLLYNHFVKFLNEGIQAVIKFKCEVEFCGKTNQELEREIDAGLETIIKALKNIKSDDPKTGEELKILIQHFGRVEELAVVELETFMNVYVADDSNNAIMKEIAESFSRAPADIHKDTSGNLELARVKMEFEEQLRRAYSNTKNLLKLNLGETTSTNMHIRTMLFEAIALAKLYERELKEISQIAPNVLV